MGTIADSMGIVAGVLLSLSGLGLLLMGVIGMATRRWRRGATAAGAGLATLVLGMWLSGVL
jgi:hypothetical protein